MQKIREKSLVRKSEGFFSRLEGENAGTGGGNGIRRGEMRYRIKNWVSRPNIDDLRHPTWTYQKVLKKCPKMREKWGGEKTVNKRKLQWQTGKKSLIKLKVRPYRFLRPLFVIIVFYVFTNGLKKSRNVPAVHLKNGIVS